MIAETNIEWDIQLIPQYRILQSHGIPEGGPWRLTAFVGVRRAAEEGLGPGLIFKDRANPPESPGYRGAKDQQSQAHNAITITLRANSLLKNWELRPPPE